MPNDKTAETERRDTYEHHHEPVLYRHGRQRPQICRGNGAQRDSRSDPPGSRERTLLIFFPMDDPETVLLIDIWKDQQALDRHHASPMMEKIARLREKYGLHMRAERYRTDESGLPESDAKYIKP